MEETASPVYQDVLVREDDNVAASTTTEEEEDRLPEGITKPIRPEGVVYSTSIPGRFVRGLKNEAPGTDMKRWQETVYFFLSFFLTGIYFFLFFFLTGTVRSFFLS